MDLVWQGAPHSVADLDKVAAGQARTVILLHPENSKVSPRAMWLRHSTMHVAGHGICPCQPRKTLPTAFHPCVSIL